MEIQLKQEIEIMLRISNLNFPLKILRPLRCKLLEDKSANLLNKCILSGVTLFYEHYWMGSVF